MYRKVEISLLLFSLFLLSTSASISSQFNLLRRLKIVDPSPGKLSYNGISLIVPSSYFEMSHTAVEFLLSRLREVVKKKGEAVVALPTGNTPQLMYEILRTQYKDDPIWKNLILLQIDEYAGAAPENETSFQYQLRKSLVSHLPFKKFISINGSAEDIQAERERYENVIRKLGGIDILFLGIGRNGHLAFHEPGVITSRAVEIVELQESTRKANNVSYRKAITLTLNEILRAKEIFLIASGKEKKEILSQALNGEISYSLPASLLRTHPRVTFIAERSAINEELQEKLKQRLKQEILTYLKGSEIRVFATGLDFTLTPLGQKIAPAVAEKLAELARQGVHIALITGNSYSTLKKVFLNQLPSNFPLENLSLYPNFGADGYYFTSRGRKVRIYPSISMLSLQKEMLEKTVQEFQQKFPEEFQEFIMQEDSKATILLKPRVRSRENYERLLEFLASRLSSVGLYINGTGHFGSIDIASADKSYALFNLRDRLQVGFDQIIYLGDTFGGRYGNDLPTIIPGVTVFNVGSLAGVPASVISLGLRSELGAQALLEAILELKGKEI